MYHGSQRMEGGEKGAMHQGGQSVSGSQQRWGDRVSTRASGRNTSLQTLGFIPMTLISKL